jgi:serine/threonine protein kinase/WD40 repeat protein
VGETEKRRNPVEELAESFLRRYRQGDRPSIAEYADKHPELAEQIRELFPALVVMEEIGAEEAAAPAAGGVTTGGRRLERIGDYRIIREVGRGGMGVVYEAEQESLGRHVALKVLPQWATRDALCLKRFRREARSAARLHHTNIVPVHEVGEAEGIHFYAMQFIQGQSLDEILRELRRLWKEPARAPEGTQASSAQGDLTNRIASELATGQFLEGDAEAQSAAQLPASPHEEAARSQEGISGGAKVDRADSSSTVCDKSSELSDPTRAGYYRSVARIGLQIAEALDYAHSHKVLHRDIKPSNLLLDLQGTPWVTDFGLAKEEGEDLTQTGDLVGTLRYMAPERFHGRCDARSDLYSLGLTLYELLTLEPAFSGTDRGHLVREITTTEPPSPQKLGRHVPRDLETIVLKAIAKEPERRYQTALALAEDLRRFLNDRPILARRVSARERLWRWRRRNPVVAALLALVTGLGLSLIGYYWLSNRQLEAEAARAKQAERDATEKLYQALFSQARALRKSGEMGQREASLRALEQAARLARDLQLEPQNFLDMRNEAIACMALPDIRITKEWEGKSPGNNGLAFDRDYQLYVQSFKDGRLSVRSVSDDAEVLSLQYQPPRGPRRNVALRFSPNSTYLSAWDWDTEASKPFYVWNIKNRDLNPVLQLPDATSHCDFRSDEGCVVIGLPGGFLGLFDLATRKETRRLPTAIPPDHLAFRPDAKTIAVSSQKQPEVRILDVEKGTVLHALKHPDGVEGIAWDPTGETLATGCHDHCVYLWDGTTGKERKVLRGHRWGIFELGFSRHGDLLMSLGFDKTFRLWDPHRGNLLETLPQASRVGFSKDDRFAGVTSLGARTGLCEVIHSWEYQTLENPGGLAWNFDVSPDGKLLAAFGKDQVRVWDLTTGKVVAKLDDTPGNTVLFNQVNGDLLTYGKGLLRRWPIHHSGNVIETSLAVGPPEVLLQVDQHNGDGRMCWVGKGSNSLLICENGKAIHVVTLDKKPAKTFSAEFPVVSFVAASPDGRWLAAGTFESGSGVRVWDVHSKTVVKEWLFGDAAVNFSPDGRWLVTGTSLTAPNGAECCFWRVGSWECEHRIRLDRTSSPAEIAFAPDGSRFAVARSMTEVLILDPNTFREVARLQSPEPELILRFTFSPDASKLAAGVGSSLFEIWDLDLIHRNLAEIGLGWRPEENRQ